MQNFLLKSCTLCKHIWMYSCKARIQSPANNSINITWSLVMFQTFLFSHTHARIYTTISLEELSLTLVCWLMWVFVLILFCGVFFGVLPLWPPTFLEVFLQWMFWNEGIPFKKKRDLKIVFNLIETYPTSLNMLLLKM